MAVNALMVWIAIHDLRFHRIPNLALLGLIIASRITPHYEANVVQGCLTLLVGLLLYRPLRIGAGDIKLAAVLALFYIPANFLVSYWRLVACIALILAIIHLIIHRSMKGEIALAPALCAAILLS